VAKSLIDGMDGFGDSPSKGKGGGPPVDRSGMIKAGVAIVLVLAVVLLFAKNFGLIGGEKIEKPSEDKAAAREKEAEQIMQEEEQMILESPEIESAGSG